MNWFDYLYITGMVVVFIMLVKMYFYECDQSGFDEEVDFSTTPVVFLLSWIMVIYFLIKKEYRDKIFG